MSLQVTYDELHDEVGRALGYGRDSSSDDVDRCVRRGLRQFYTPEPLSGERVGHRWSFLRTVESLTTHVATQTGTLSANGTDVTSISPALVTDDAKSISHIEITVSGTKTKHLVSSVSSTTALTLSVTSGASSASGLQYTIFYNGSYALPIPFAGIDGPLTYDTLFGADPNRADQTIEVTSEAKLRDMAQYLEDRDDKPRAAAIVQTGATGTAGTSHRIQFFPIPDAEFRLEYTQINEPVHISGSESAEPLGGALHGETILASCLAVAEQFFIPNSPHGYQDSYRRRLAASVELDRQAIRSEALGYNSDPSIVGSLNRFQHPRLSRYIQDNSVTINGVQY